MRSHPPTHAFALFTLCALVMTLLAGAIAPAAGAQATSSIRITMRGCPDGPINPFANSLDSCTIPLDAPDAAIASWGEGTANWVRVHEAEREFNGTYVIDNIPGNATVWLRGFEATAHNNFEIIGGDDQVPPDPWTAKIQLVPGTTRDIVAFYWNGDGGFSQDDSGTLTLRLRGCPDGVDPATVADPKSTCTTPLDAPDAAYVTWDMESGAKVSIAPRQNDGTYVIDNVPPFQHVGLTGFDPTVRDAFLAVGNDYTVQGRPYVLMHRAETAHIDIYYYTIGNGNGGQQPAGEATLNLTLRGCPDDFQPTATNNPQAVCTTPLDAPDAAGVIWGGDGQGGMPLADATRLYDGTYQILVPANWTLELRNFEPSVRDSFEMIGIDGAPAGVPYVVLNPGDVRQVYVYYYNNP